MALSALAADPVPGSLRIDWQDEELVLLPARALWLPHQSALLIADWHLGKDDVLRRAGIALPAGSLSAELARLDMLLAATAARELVVLGDLVHGEVRERAPWRREFGAWRSARRGLRLRVARGNHDAGIGSLAGEADEIAPVLALGSICGVHEVDGTGGGARIGGHLHPVVQLRAGRQRERVPVFWLRADCLVLPAFGRLTGGWPLPRDACGQAWAALERSVIPLPAARRRTR